MSRFQKVAPAHVSENVDRLLPLWDNLPYDTNGAPWQSAEPGLVNPDLPPGLTVIRNDRLFYSAVASVGALGVVTALHMYADHKLGSRSRLPG